MPRIKKPTPDETKSEEAEKKIGAALGNTNQEQIDRRNAIADRADEYRGADLQDTDGDKIIPRDPEEEKSELEARETEAERARLEAEANEAEARRLQSVEPSSKTYTLKVNGRDVQMTERELLERASKVASADEYLQTAADAVKRATALGPSRDVSASDAGGITEDTLTSALQGDREAIQKLLQRFNAPVVNREVIQAVDERTRFLRDVDEFRREYKDIVGDPFLYRLVVEEDRRIAESEPSLGYSDRLKKAGDSIRTWKQGFTKVSETNPKLIRKASVPQVPAAGARQSTREEEETEESPEDVIDAMAKARGQEQAIRRPEGLFKG